MVATLPQIIGKINPELYATNAKELLKEYKSKENIPTEKVIAKPLASHTLVYDSSSETLEPIYFFILDLMNDYGLAPQKYIDNFSSSPGSGHFGELGQRATVMQQQAAKLMGDVNTVLRSILNVIYDLKEFRIRLQTYDDLKSGDKDSAILSLKQIWMDKVDITKGNSSLKAMGLGQAGFATLIDAFLAAKELKDVDKLDLNDRVKRILKPRVHEFYAWLTQSESELRKRYELEKTYLKSQVNSLKLYSRWAKPYLRVAQELESKEMGREAALVKTFNTIILELTLLGKNKIDVEAAALQGDLPRELKKIKTKRGYNSCVLVEFRFRGIPQRVGGQQSHYTFGGRTEVTFMSYALNDDELKKIDEEFEKSDVSDVLKLVEGATTESLDQLDDEINFFLEEESIDKIKSKPKDTSNPFFALIGKYNKESEKKEVPKKSEDKKEPLGPIQPDTFIEKTQIRALAMHDASETTFNLFDVYKKAHGMPSYT
ncbi:hypothetical protein KAI04_04745 [Candidatus Pacearchaeota archaeon]|nr:hypothetical protein [Candidatus Pacearchaeota archaeon]